jgi:hypothetical protein
MASSTVSRNENLDVGEAVGKLDVEEDVVSFNVGHEQSALVTFQPLVQALTVSSRF